MRAKFKTVEANVPFAESMIWKVNRSYYEDAGLSAWSDGVVPHNMTSNSYVGKTYAALILGFLKDIANNGAKPGKVYIVELGSGHGRLAYHILKQLTYLISLENGELPDYCFVLTDIIESNLVFFEDHPQFQSFFESGQLDVAYFDGTESKTLVLRKNKTVITKDSQQYTMIAIANYFFDSLPNKLYQIQHNRLSSCSMTIESYLDVHIESPGTILKNLKSTIHIDQSAVEPDKNPFINQLLSYYTDTLNDTYLLIPSSGIECIQTLKNLSTAGLMILTIDKGYTQISDLEARPIPEIIRHGSFSIYVNFHALGRYCDYHKGKTLFSASGDSSLQMGCLLLVDDPEKYKEIYKAYDLNIHDFGPDDYNGMKKMIYRLVKELTLHELIITMRMGFYDSTLFLQLLPFIKKKTLSLSVEDRNSLALTLHKIENLYFDIKEPLNTSYEIAGIFYDLGFHKEALHIFNNITKNFGEVADIYYNKILCYYQLRMDELFTSTLIEAKLTFPDYEKFEYLEQLDLAAV